MNSIFGTKHAIWTNGKGKKVYVGLSGGVDSAVSAALLQEQGYEVHGIFIRIALPGYPCSAGRDKQDAMRVAAHLQIPFEEVDLSKEYEEQVFRISIAEFAKGRTPNPDILCNREVKFGVFFDYCMRQGADFVATGHYAQTAEGLLYKGADRDKDQSYFLWAVPETALLKTLFPVGHLRKPQVRKLAHQHSLPNAGRPDSQGLCFLGDVTVADMLNKELAPVPGDVLSLEGEVVGRHEGALLYTLGQRHGFSILAQGTTTVPHYVVEKDMVFNTITVSPSKFPTSASTTEITMQEINFIGPVEPGLCEARFRYRQPLIAGVLESGKEKVTLTEPYYAPEGQSLVLYRGERCLGGGVIEKSRLH